jgi:hypothetical protein
LSSVASDVRVVGAVSGWFVSACIWSRSCAAVDSVGEDELHPATIRTASRVRMGELYQITKEDPRRAEPAGAECQPGIETTDLLCLSLLNL